MKTKSEEIFESFCTGKRISFKRIPEGASKTPDYFIEYKSQKMIVEIKQIDRALKAGNGVYAGQIGRSIRNAIHESKDQIKEKVKKHNLPSCIIVYNNSDPLRFFGTDILDFLSAMYGELTYTYDQKKSKFTNYYCGKHTSLTEEHNTSISAVGNIIANYAIKQNQIYLYTNPYAQLKMPPIYKEVFQIREIKIENST